MPLVSSMDSVSFDADSEDALALRFGLAEKKHVDLVFEFSRDPGLLHQYHRLYEEEFRTVQNACHYHHQEDEHDRRAQFLIVRQGNFCVGGARLSSKTPRQPHLLPMEIGDFRIEDHLPYLKHKELRYGQVGRVCLLPEFRGGGVTRMMFWHLHRKILAMGLDVFFGTAPIYNTRANRKHLLAIGVTQTKVHFDINIPAYPGCEEVKMYLMSIIPNRSQENGNEAAPTMESLMEDAG